MNTLNVTFELSFRGQDYKVEAEIDTVERDEADIAFTAINLESDKVFTERDNFQLTQAVRKQIEEDFAIDEVSDQYDNYLLG